MANYDPPQPLWKRNVAAILDFLLVLIIGGYLLAKLPGNQPSPTPSFGPGTTTTQLVGIGGWPAIALIVVIIAYFLILGRTGGTVFQRLFGMKRVK
jgi:TRAP-type C4-dicarboxylate transport system permease small subunit